METTASVACPLPGLEAVTVTYNLMASQDEIDAWSKRLGGPVEANGTEPEAANGTEPEEHTEIVTVTGWPGGKFGPEPFGPKAPMVFRIWAAQKGLQGAIRAYVTDPN